MPAEKVRKQIVRASIQQTADSMIVHDMKNLAFRLSALLQNAEDRYDDPVFKQSMMEILADTIGKMNAIVKRFRENRQQVIVKLRVDLNQILTEVITGFPPRAFRNIDVKLLLPELPSIWADRFYLHNAFHSIIQNALEAMPEGGRLTVRTKLQRNGGNRTILVEISDTGTGMNADQLKKLFTPFTTSKKEGLGLGLYTSQQIFSLHHGKIEVESAPESGTTFRVILPANENGS